MKKLLFAFFLVSIISCNSGKTAPNKLNKDTSTIRDTIKLSNTQKPVNDSLIHLIDSLKTKLFLANYKVEQVKFYVKICERKPNQKIFLIGWLKRCLY